MKTISFSTAFLLVAGFASTGLGAPTASRHVVARGGNDGGDYSYGTCSNPIVRKEWRALTTEQRSDYIDAVKCMMALPAIDTANVPGAVSRFDDFQGGHILATDSIHYVGQFLPWHRYFVSVYEKAIREECGWTLGQPYWDWTQDYQNWPGSEIWDPTTGFGGNGVYVDNCPEVTVTCLPGGTGGGCITDGPFVNITVHLGPADQLERNDRCLSRDFHSQYPEQYFAPSAMDATMSLPTFDEFRQSLEGLLNDVNHIGQHGSGHGGTGGAMVDLFASPGDPLFYLHHGQLDRLWWQWQNVNIDERLYEIAGPTRNYTVASPNVTLDYMLDVGALADQVPIYDVMNIGGSLCYTYE